MWTIADYNSICLFGVVGLGNGEGGHERAVRCIFGVDATFAAPMNPNSKSVVASSIIDKGPKSIQQDVLSLFVNGYRLQHGEANFDEIY